MHHRPEIDGLRAVAVLPVVLYHAGVPPFQGGFVGVDVFFVISGYLITALMLAEHRAGTFRLLDFYERRARRILPLLFTVMLASLPLAWALLPPNALRGFADSLLATASFVSNLFFWRTAGYFDTAVELKPLLHTWSLAVEEQFYLLFPLVLALAWRWRRRHLVAALALVALASLAFAQWAVATHPRFAFYWLPARAWELLAGALLAALGTQAPARVPAQAARLLGLLGVALLLVPVFAYDDRTPFPGLWALPPVLGTVLILAFAVPGTPVGRLLATRPLVGIGLISYGLYLWHQPMFAFLRHASVDEPGWPSMLALGVAAAGLAVLSWRWVEQPMRDRRRVDRTRLVALCGTAAALLMVAGLAGELTEGFRGRAAPGVLAAEAAIDESRRLQDADDCHIESAGDDRLRGCVRGAAGVPPAVALIGDSHAATFAGALARRGRVEGGSFVQYTKNECGFAAGLVATEDLRCDAFQAAGMADIKRRGIGTLVVVTRWDWYAADEGADNGEGGHEKRTRLFGIAADGGVQAPAAARHAAVMQAFTATLRAARAEGLSLVVVHAVPEMGWNVPTRLAKGLREGAPAPAWASIDAGVNRARHRGSDALLDALLDVLPDAPPDAHPDAPTVRHLRPADVLCDTVVPGRCVAHVDGRPMYYDDDHLTDAAATRVLATLTGRLWPTPIN